MLLGVNLETPNIVRSLLFRPETMAMASSNAAVLALFTFESLTRGGEC